MVGSLSLAAAVRQQQLQRPHRQQQHQRHHRPQQQQRQQHMFRAQIPISFKTKLKGNTVRPATLLQQLIIEQ